MAASDDSSRYAYEIEPGIPADATFPWLVRIKLPKGAAAESYLRFEHPLVQKLAAVIAGTGWEIHFITKSAMGAYDLIKQIIDHPEKLMRDSKESKKPVEPFPTILGLKKMLAAAHGIKHSKSDYVYHLYGNGRITHQVGEQYPIGGPESTIAAPIAQAEFIPMPYGHHRGSAMPTFAILTEKDATRIRQQMKILYGLENTREPSGTENALGATVEQIAILTPEDLHLTLAGGCASSLQ